MTPARKTTPEPRAPKPARMTPARKTTPEPRAPKPARMVPARKPSRAEIAARKARNAERAARRTEERARIESLVRAIRRDEVRRERKREEDRERRRREYKPRSVEEPLPIRKGKKPKRLRDRHGRFAPADTRGEETGKFIDVFEPGWMRQDGTIANNYSSLRDHEDAKKIESELRQVGDVRSKADLDALDQMSQQIFKDKAKEMAERYQVHLQEVYTLCFSP